ncbi:hypothetical protein [Polyangium aurulentum]|uniref:hypothetical protein n=1 Tax=Polyangium aurulentum TaxID=2567896 RepID=UPI0010AEE4B0|nr:hypothetical protein [Polyangium aurulentum]UQA55286.1 hypothetical protein E8A73_028530 [Polyangium aurulentum]
MRNIVIFAAIALVVGCSKGEETAAKPAATGAAADKAAAPAAKAEAKGDLAEVDLTPLPLKIKAPPGGKGAMDMSRDDKKSVTVDIGGGTSLNISETQDDFAAVKKKQESDKMLFPFKKWAKEDANLAVVQFENEGKTGYVGFAMKEIGGKKYVCKTTGMDGVASAELAETQLKSCDTLAAK